ncbi:MAG TPA: ABC transporter substrate-binding protein [Thermomicrobiaceae bacterium]|nr:ABC transporter substrate-binding protein [Thermomicrobiaceae bacterium]
MPGLAGLSRRKFLRFAAGSTALAALSTGLLACGGSSSSPTTAPAATSGTSGGTAAPTTAGSGGSGATSTTAGGSTATSASAPSGDFAKNVTVTIPIATTIDITLDPHKAINSLLLFNLYDYVFGGVTKYDKDAHVVPDLSDKWEASQDGLTYTFHLRDGIKFANGRAVTPDDFLYSWKRSLDPKKPSPMAHFLEHVEGYEDYLGGKATDLTGFKKVDDKTIQVTLSKPYNFFLSYSCTYVFWVVDKDLVEKYGDDNNSDWTNHQPYGTGPWKVTKFDPATTIEMVPNENFWGEPSPSVTKVNWPILKGPTGPNQALNLYKAGQADIVSNFPLSLLDAVEKDNKDEILPVTVGGTRSVALSFTKKPFDNVLVRLAFGMAIDRDTYCKTVWRGAYTPTDHFEPPAIKDYDPPKGIAYDPDGAKKVLEAAGFPNGQGLPPITLYIPSDTSAEDVNRYRALADMWNKTLGANVQINTAFTNTQIIDKRTQEKGFQMELMGWINITETPQLMSEVFRTDSPYMKDRFDWGIEVPAKTYNGVTYDPTADAKKFDELMNQADIEQDPKKRNQLYHDGEALILKNAIYVPFGNYVYRELINPKLKGLEWGAFFYTYPVSIKKNVVMEK